MTGSQKSFETYTKIDYPIDVWVANGKKSPVVGWGSIHVSCILLKDALCVPNLTYNLLLVSKLTKDLNT